MVRRSSARRVLACDFLTVETLWLKTIYVLFFIELGTRRVHNSLGHPAGPEARLRAGGSVVARPVPGPRPRREVLRSVQRGLSDRGRQGDRTPIRAPRAKAFAERWARTVRNECLDWILIHRIRHLERVLRAYAPHYNDRRRHRGIDLAAPGDRESPPSPSIRSPRLDRRDLLGGLIHKYELAA